MVLCTCVCVIFVLAGMVFAFEEDAIVFTYYCKVVLWCSVQLVSVCWSLHCTVQKSTGGGL
jgi:hypothetical protein